MLLAWAVFILSGSAVTIVRMEASAGELRLTIERTFSAPGAVVFTAFTDARELAKWWGPEGFRIPEIEFEPVVGAPYRIAMQPPEGDVFHLDGEFRAVEPLVRLAYTFVWNPPDPDDVETLVNLSFRDLDGSTSVELQQGAFKTEARVSLHRDGWTESFDKLDRILAARI